MLLFLMLLILIVLVIGSYIIYKSSNWIKYKEDWTLDFYDTGDKDEE